MSWVVLPLPIESELQRKAKRKAELKDILLLMITAGADVCAVNDCGITVSDVAHQFGHCQIWTDVLEACGYDVDEVRQGTDISLGWSSAVEPPRTRQPGERASKLSFADYLKQRKAFCSSTEIIDYQNAEDDLVQEYRENGSQCAWFRAEGSTGRDDLDEENSREETDIGDEDVWAWSEDDDITQDLKLD